MSVKFVIYWWHQNAKARMDLLMWICCIFAEQIFEEKLWGTASENNSFEQVNCKFCLHKLKWTKLILQNFSNYLFVCHLQNSALQIIKVGQQSVLRIYKIKRWSLTTSYTFTYLFLRLKLFWDMWITIYFFDINPSTLMC